MYDQKTNQFESILPLALQMRGKQLEVKKPKISPQFVSASTARESNASDPNNDSSDQLGLSEQYIEIMEDDNQEQDDQQIDSGNSSNNSKKK